MGQNTENGHLPVSDKGPQTDRGKANGAVRPAKPAKLTLRQKVWAKVEAFIWVAAALFLVFYGDGLGNDIASIAMHDSRVRRYWLYAGLGLIGANFVIFLYLTVWWRHVRKLPPPATTPIAAHVATSFGVAAGITLTVAGWRVWTYLTPVVLAVLYMGTMMAPHLVPYLGARQLR